MTSSPSTVAGGARPRFEAVTPRVPVLDVEAALIFYCKRLGFELGWRWGAPLTHANVCRDAIGLDLIRVPADRGGPAMVYIQVCAIDAYYAELGARGVRVGDLGDREYGMRDFEVIDPDGNRLAFGEPIPDRYGRAGASKS
jgi:catechol 2,3-dioxygenase-like lactoylglutathione lyase family enzyme